MLLKYIDLPVKDGSQKVFSKTTGTNYGNYEPSIRDLTHSQFLKIQPKGTGYEIKLIEQKKIVAKLTLAIVFILFFLAPLALLS